MSQSEEHFREIEKNVILLLNKLKDNYLLIQSLQSKLKEFDTTNLNLKEQIDSLKQKNSSLSVANSLLGSNDSKKETKDKINSLVKDIDNCLNQLESSF